MHQQDPPSGSVTTARTAGLSLGQRASSDCSHPATADVAGESPIRHRSSKTGLTTTRKRRTTCMWQSPTAGTGCLRSWAETRRWRPSAASSPRAASIAPRSSTSSGSRARQDPAAGRDLRAGRRPRHARAPRASARATGRVGSSARWPSRSRRTSPTSSPRRSAASHGGRQRPAPAGPARRRATARAGRCQRPGRLRAVRRVHHPAGPHRPVLLALDDVQWSDEGTLDVLHQPLPPPASGRRGRRARATGRCRASHALADVRPGRIEGPVVGSLHRFELAPLTEPQLAELLPDATPARRRALFGACGGNPFFVQAVMPGRPTSSPTRRRATGCRPPYATRSRTSSTPSTRADPPGRRHGGCRRWPVDPDLVARVADLSMNDVLDALDALSARTICRPVAPGRWQFRHPLLARAVYDAQPAASRFRAHHAAAVRAGPRGCPAGRAGPPPGRGEPAWRRRGGADPRRRRGPAGGQAPGQAASWYAAALDIAPQAEVAGGARRSSWPGPGRWSPSVGSTRRTRSCTTSSRRRRRRPGADRRHRARCPGRLPARSPRRGRGHPPAGAGVACALGARRPGRGPCRAGHRPADERRLRRRQGGRRARSRAGSRLRPAHGGRRRRRDHAQLRRQWRHRAGAGAPGDRRPLVDGLSDGELAASLEVGVWLGWAEMFLEQVDSAKRHLERCLRIARRGAHQHLLTHLLVGWGSVLKITGDLAGATEAYDEAREAAERVGSRELTTMATAMQCRAATWRGDMSRGRAARRGSRRHGGGALELVRLGGRGPASPGQLARRQPRRAVSRRSSRPAAAPTCPASTPTRGATGGRRPSPPPCSRATSTPHGT